MRASEDRERHNEERQRLLRLLEQKNRELKSILALAKSKDSAGASGERRHDRNEDVAAIESDINGIKNALVEHLGTSSHPVRNYRIIDLQRGSVLNEFTVDYEVALGQRRRRWRQGKCVTTNCKSSNSMAPG